jgi:signal transduction histidine kinase
MSEMRTGPRDRRAASANRKPPPPRVRLTTLQRLGATGGIAAIVLLLGILTLDAVFNIRAARAGVIATHQAIEATQSTLQDLTNAETGQRGYLLTNDERYLEPYHAALLAVTSDTARLRRLVGADAIQRGQLDSLHERIGAKLDELSQTIALNRTAGFAAAREVVRDYHGKAAMDGVRRLLSSIASRQEALLDQRIVESDRHYAIVEAIIVGGTIAAVLIALLLNTLLTRFADSQTDAAHRLDAQNIVLSDANCLLGEQTLELELQNQQLQDQTNELDAQQRHLEQQAGELEMQSAELTESLEELQKQTAFSEEARAAAEEASSRADEANRAKSLFLTTMSHELRTPLNAIGGYVDLLALEIRGPVVEAQREDLRRIKKNAQHLLSLINDILNLAKIESGQLDLDIRDVSLAAVFDNVDALVAPQFNAKGIVYSYPECDASLLVRGDSEKLQQILLNLLSNACKFTDDGGRVTVECDEGGAVDGDGARTVAISIRDTGRGIANDKLEDIFEPFVQIDRQLTGASQQGVGLGLAISRDLARSMSGDLVAESTSDVGATFVLTLPRGGASLNAHSSTKAPRDSSAPISAA